MNVININKINDLQTHMKGFNNNKIEFIIKKYDFASIFDKS